ncbi:hypothetical protein COO60DRAFT_1492348 [Scenedesmus sp. NREL 46B-D3]|nr:hypothetical protein COO60DRAFT_1492348 [Scenedesmus sp. NREL 46B-D3]
MSTRASCSGAMSMWKGSPVIHPQAKNTYTACRHPSSTPTHLLTSLAARALTRPLTRLAACCLQLPMTVLGRSAASGGCCCCCCCCWQTSWLGAVAAWDVSCGCWSCAAGFAQLLGLACKADECCATLSNDHVTGASGFLQKNCQASGQFCCCCCCCCPAIRAVPSGSDMGAGPMLQAAGTVLKR